MNLIPDITPLYPPLKGGTKRAETLSPPFEGGEGGVK